MPYDASQNHGYSDLVYRYQPGGPMPEIRRTAYGETQQAAQGQGVQAESEPYYMVGRRPLDFWGGQTIYNDAGGLFDRGWNHDLRTEHQQFIRSDGVNFGFGPEGIFSENQESLKAYTYDSPGLAGKKLRADLIDEARDIFEKQREEIQRVLNKVNYRFSTTWEKAEDLPRYQYNIIGNNCQDYVGEIMEIAQKLARKRGISLYID